MIPASAYLLHAIAADALRALFLTVHRTVMMVIFELVHFMYIVIIGRKELAIGSSELLINRSTEMVSDGFISGFSTATVALSKPIAAGAV